MNDVAATRLGSYVSLAATEDGFCALTNAQVVECFGGETGPGDLTAFGATLDATSRFLPDMGGTLCATTSTNISCIGDLGVGGTVDFDMPEAGGANCGVYATKVACDGGTQTYDPLVSGTTFVDVAVSERTACVLDGAGAVTCYDISAGMGTALPIHDDQPLPPLEQIHAASGDSYCGLRLDGQMHCWRTDPNSSNRPFVQARPERMASLSTPDQNGWCGATVDGEVRCWGAGFEGANVPPPGSGWVDVELAGTGSSWIHAASLPLVSSGAVADGQRITGPFDTELRSYFDGNPGMVECGLQNGEVVCPTGTNIWGVPAGPWDDLALSHYYYAWCGIRSSNQGLECASTRTGTTLDQVPSGAFTQVAVNASNGSWTDDYACALATDGRIWCWGDGSAATVTTVSDFVRVGYASGRMVGQRMAGEVVDLGTQASEQGEIFASYVGEFGIRSNGTLAYWGRPTWATPTGTFLSAGASPGLRIPPGATPSDLNRCGLRSNGDLTCWYQDGATVKDEVTVTGPFDDAVYGSNAVWLDVGGGHWRSLSYFVTGDVFGPVNELVQGWEDWCAIDTTGMLACGGLEWQGPGNEYVSDGLTYRGLVSNGGDMCAIDQNDQARCFQATAPTPAIDDYQLLSVAAENVCGTVDAGNWVRCSGPNAWGPLTATPFPLQNQPIVDLAASEFLICMIDVGGTIDCVGNWGWDVGPSVTGPYKQLEMTPWATVACLIDGSDGLVCYDPSGTPNWTPIWSPTGTFSDVSVGNHSICALRTNGTGECFGLEVELAAL